ncbi:MAG: pyridoxamine 5'-phosphate oxidase family protein [Candidatus Heimdallarchaeaceae archaeon]|nr:pyridoxamine 5'-phosphate oxidase family protein [Candidatus Heimdallarchaeota archaeon]
MRGIRRKEKAITDEKILKKILSEVAYVTIALCKDNQPYLVSLSHGYDPDRNCIYFHCASEGKKIDYLKENNVVWGQAIIDKGYIQGSCDHLYATTQFKGKVTFVNDFEEKKEILINMVHKLDDNPDVLIEKQLTQQSISKITVGRIDIEYMSGKEAKEALISL